MFSSLGDTPFYDCNIAHIADAISLYPSNSNLGVFIEFNDEITICIRFIKDLLSQILGREIVGISGQETSFVRAVDNEGNEIILGCDSKNAAIVCFSQPVPAEGPRNSIAFFIHCDISKEFDSLAIQYYFAHLFRPQISSRVILGIELIHISRSRSIENRARKLSKILFNKSPTKFISHHCETDQGWGSAIAMTIKIGGKSRIICNKPFNIEWSSFGLSVIPCLTSGLIEYEIIKSKNWAIVIAVDSSQPGMDIIAGKEAIKQLKEECPKAFVTKGPMVKLERAGLAVSRIAESLSVALGLDQEQIKFCASKMLESYYS